MYAEDAVEEQEKHLEIDKGTGSPPAEEGGGRALQEGETAGAKVWRCGCSKSEDEFSALKTPENSGDETSLEVSAVTKTETFRLYIECPGFALLIYSREIYIHNMCTHV